MILLTLLATFGYIGLVSFGGGFAMIPIIEHEAVRHGWMTNREFTDVIAVAGMSPGPIALNSAIFVGYRTAGIPGAIAAALGTILPSFIIVVLTALFFYKVRDSVYTKYLFYGLRPVVVGLILYSAFKFADSNHMIGKWGLHTAGLLAIFGISLFCMMKYRMHPLWVIAGSGLIGILFYV